MILGIISRLAGRAGLLTVTILLLSGCGSQKRETPAVPELSAQRMSPAASAEISLDGALAELDAYPCPEGVDAQLWAELKDALASQLESRFSNRDSSAGHSRLESRDSRYGGKIVSTPPIGEVNKVTDLAIADNGDGTFTLTWSYRNSGDYDQNNTVGISDITPIAMHYGETYEPADENCKAAVVDGSCNCCVDIADITPIAMNYATDCAGYRIQGGNSPEGSFTTIRNESLDGATGDGRLGFSEGFVSIAYLYLRVVPYGAQMEDGEPSDAILVPANPPEISSVSPLIGLEGESVQFTVENSGTPPFTYAWDFGGGAEPDTSSLPSPSVTLNAIGEYEAQITVTNIFGEDVFPFTLTVNPAPPEIFSVSPTEGVSTGPVQFSAEVTGTEPITYSWDFCGGADPDTSDEASPSVTLGSPGEYSASLTVTNDAGVDTFTFTLTVTEIEELVADAKPDNPTGIIPFTVNFMGSATGGVPPYTYQWDFTDDETWDSSEQNPTYIYEDVGSHTCRLRITDYVDAWDEDTSGIAVSEVSERGDWWMLGREPTHNRRSPYVGAQTGILKWSYATGDHVASSPAIGADGTIYVGSYDYYLYAINADGSLKWRYETAYPVRSSPAIGADGTIYVGSRDNYLYAFHPDGTLKWSYETGYDVRSSPAIAVDGTIYVGSRDNYLYALKPDGTLKWSYETGGDVRSSPAIGADGTIYAGSTDSYLYALHPDGTLKWSYETGGVVRSSPAIGVDGTIYVGSRDNYLYALKPDGSLKWSYETGNYVFSSPAIGADGTIYVGSNDYYLYALKPDGTLKWRYETGYPVSSSPAIGADGTIYVGSDDYYIYALNPDGTLKWRYETGYWVGSSPAIGADGTIYVGSFDGYLYAFGD